MFSSRSMSGFLFPHAGFSVFSFHMPILVYAFWSSWFLVLFTMRSQCMNMLYLHAAIPVGFFKVRTCYYMLLHFHELAIVWLMFSLLFLANPCTILLQINVLWLQSRSCFTAIFVTWLCRAWVRTRGLNFITPWSCLQFVGNCGSRAEVFSC